MKKLSIICAYRNRPDRIDTFVSSFSSLYPDAELVVIEQMDNKLFNKGFLYNAGTLYCCGDILAFIDVDIRIKECIPLHLLDEPFYPYTRIIQCDADIKEVESKKRWVDCPGGFYVVPKQLCISVNGHSNLFSGHGWEDTNFKNRANIQKRLDNTIYHIEHPQFTHTSAENKKNRLQYNKQVDSQLDGLSHMHTVDVLYRIHKWR